MRSVGWTENPCCHREKIADGADFRVRGDPRGRPPGLQRTERPATIFCALSCGYRDDGSRGRLNHEDVGVLAEHGRRIRLRLRASRGGPDGARRRREQNRERSARRWCCPAPGVAGGVSSARSARVTVVGHRPGGTQVRCGSGSNRPFRTSKIYSNSCSRSVRLEARGVARVFHRCPKPLNLSVPLTSVRTETHDSRLVVIDGPRN